MIKLTSYNFYTIAAIIMGCFFILSCENDYEEVKNLNKKSIGVEEGRQIESFLSQNGQVKAKLKAPVMLRYQFDTPKVEFPKTLHVTFFDDSTQVESELSAKYGRYLENENKVFLRDSVVVFNVTGDTLLTQELYWDQLQQTFYTDKKVIIRKPDQKIYGSGLVADQNFKWFTIKNIQNSILNIRDSTYLGN